MKYGVITMKIVRRAFLAMFALFFAVALLVAYLRLSDASEKSWYWMTVFSRPALLQKLKAEPRITAIDFPVRPGWILTLILLASGQEQEVLSSRDNMAAFMKWAKNECDQRGISFTAYMNIVESLRDMDMDGFSYVYGHDDDGDHICRPARMGMAAVGIIFTPSDPLTIRHWYYALDGKEPPETAPYGVIKMWGGWYFLTP